MIKKWNDERKSREPLRAMLPETGLYYDFDCSWVMAQTGWGRMNLGFQGDDGLRFDREGLVGLPVVGFAAYQFKNDFFADDDIQAFYGGLFGHKYNVRRIGGIDID